jgi:hypothetical protein
MWKFWRKVEDVLARITTVGFSVAIFLLSIGALIWSVKWILDLVGMM